MTEDPFAVINVYLSPDHILIEYKQADLLDFLSFIGGTSFILLAFGKLINTIFRRNLIKALML